MNQATRKQWIGIAIVVVITALLAALILFQGSEGDAHGDHAEAESSEKGGRGAGEAEAYKKGPHGGKLFVQDGYAVELTIFEQDVEPEFRIYTYKDGKALDPAASRASVTVERLGRTPQRFSFKKENDYLRGDAVVVEPHSFKVTMVSEYAGKSYRFGYDQIEARVTMPDQRVKENGIEVLTSSPARIEAVLQLIGEIRLNEDRTVHIVPQLDGVVESVAVSAGDLVRKGQVLAVMSSQSLVSLRSELQAAQKRAELARSVFQREKQLWDEKISAEQDVIQARSAMQEADIALHAARQRLAALGAGASASGNLSRYDIRSPINGTITEKRLAVGAALKNDASVLVVADLSTVWAEMTVQAKDLNTVKVGQTVTIRAAALDQKASGTVSYVGALVGAQTRSAMARVVLANPGAAWRPGLPVNVELVTGGLSVPVSVATEAIQMVNDGPAVFGRYGDNFEARPLKIGRSDGKTTEVLEGLLPGERYAAKNSFLLKAELGKAGASHDH